MELKDLEVSIEELFSKLSEKIKNRVIEEIGSANEEQIKEIVFELRLDMQNIIDERVKINLSNIFSKLSEDLKSTSREGR